MPRAEAMRLIEALQDYLNAYLGDGGRGKAPADVPGLDTAQQLLDELTAGAAPEEPSPGQLAAQSASGGGLAGLMGG